MREGYRESIPLKTKFYPPRAASGFAVDPPILLGKRGAFGYKDPGMRRKVDANSGGGSGRPGGRASGTAEAEARPPCVFSKVCYLSAH